MPSKYKALKNYYEPQQQGFVLLPILLILLSLLLLLALSLERFYTHVIFTHAVNNYLQAEQAFIKALPSIENTLTIAKEPQAWPENYEFRLKNYSLWPRIQIGLYTLYYQTQVVQVLTRLSQSELFYSSLIVVGTKETPKLIMYELISFCSLAESHCRPLQLTQIR